MKSKIEIEVKTITMIKRINKTKKNEEDNNINERKSMKKCANWIFY